MNCNNYVLFSCLEIHVPKIAVNSTEIRMPNKMLFQFFLHNQSSELSPSLYRIESLQSLRKDKTFRTCSFQLPVCLLFKDNSETPITSSEFSIIIGTIEASFDTSYPEKQIAKQYKLVGRNRLYHNHNVSRLNHLPGRKKNRTLLLSYTVWICFSLHSLYARP